MQCNMQHTQSVHNSKLLVSLCVVTVRVGRRRSSRSRSSPTRFAMYIIFKIKARLLPVSPFHTNSRTRCNRRQATPPQQPASATCCVAQPTAIAALNVQRHYGTAIRACVCIYSSPLFDPELCGGNGLQHGGGQSAMAALSYTADPDDEEACCWWDEEAVWGIAEDVNVFALLMGDEENDDDGEDGGEDGADGVDQLMRAMQRAEAERSCGRGMLSVSALEEMWVEKIETELVKIGKRRRRRKRLVLIDGDAMMMRK